MRILENPYFVSFSKCLKINIKKDEIIFSERLVSLKAIKLDENGTFSGQLRLEGKGGRIVDFKPSVKNWMFTIREDGNLGLLQYDIQKKKCEEISNMKIKKDFETAPKCLDVCENGELVVVLFEDLDKRASKVYLFEVFSAYEGYLFLFKNLVDLRGFYAQLNDLKFLPYDNQSCVVTGVFSNKVDDVLTMFWDSKNRYLEKVDECQIGRSVISKGVEKMFVIDEDVFSVGTDGTVFTYRYQFGDLKGDEDLEEKYDGEEIML